MQTKVQNLGENLALLIPKQFAVQANLSHDSVVELSFENGKVVLCLLAEKALTLDQLLAGVSEQNLHHEIDAGSPVGNEVW